MTLNAITDWIHAHAATLTIETRTDLYAGLQVTVRAANRTTTVSGQGQWDLLDAISAAIAAWGKAGRD